jgi:hypothetical protein
MIVLVHVRARDLIRCLQKVSRGVWSATCSWVWCDVLPVVWLAVLHSPLVPNLNRLISLQALLHKAHADRKLSGLVTS